MIGYYPAAQIRAAEEATGPLLTGGVLMARAAAGVARVALSELRERCGGVYGRRVGLVVGAGNNGGDALYAGARLARSGAAVQAVLPAPDAAHPGGLAAFRAAGGRVVPTLSPDTDLVIDAVVGLGGHGPLRPAAADAFAAVPGVPVLAVDLPSGIDPDTGQVHDPSVTATVSVTFGARRLAHLLAAPRCGRIEVIDIGLAEGESSTLGEPAVASLTDAEVAALWPLPGPADDKYTQGVAGIVAGSEQYPGAAVLCTGGSIAATSGMTRFVGGAAAVVVGHRPEVVAVHRIADAGTVQAWVVGPGLGTGAHAEHLVEHVLAADVPALVDADGLTVLARRPDLLAGRTAPTLLTPHAGEYARLAGHPVGPDRLAAVRELAAELGVTVLLKGRITLVADPDGTVLGNDAGSSWAATAGAGDVLSGMAGALLAAGLPPRPAGAAAARVHARAALLAEHGGPPGPGGAPIGASDLVAAVPQAIRELEGLGQ
ncbi:NAD(P)H-hydrate dehydratase [Gordonia caeni]|uniref:Bifunctional NAD(P)H-hydrate repair enzyme n=1 Tax=Gordonia caeni TaxID=1007097 RepID=A0ABP7PIM8_9ACTN